MNTAYAVRGREPERFVAAVPDMRYAVGSELSSKSGFVLVVG